MQLKKGGVGEIANFGMDQPVFTCKSVQHLKTFCPKHCWTCL